MNYTAASKVPGDIEITDEIIRLAREYCLVMGLEPDELREDGQRTFEVYYPQAIRAHKALKTILRD